MAKRPIVEVTVAQRQQLTPNVVRMTLSGEALSKLPEDCAGGYMKTMFPSTGTGLYASLLDLAGIDTSRTIKRSYTIRSVDPAQQKLVLDFTEHGAGGPAAEWLASAKVGDPIVLTGPGPIKMLDPTVDCVFLAGDMTGLAAIAVNLQRLPKTMRGLAVIEILSEDDKQSLDAPEGVELHWVVTPDPHASKLAQEVRRLPWPGTAGERVGVWSATEFSSMKSLRAYFRDERAVNKDDMYISSYWKLDSSDEQHKRAKILDR